MIFPLEHPYSFTQIHHLLMCYFICSGMQSLRGNSVLNTFPTDMQNLKHQFITAYPIPIPELWQDHAQI